jgi:hypothetical protein
LFPKSVALADAFAAATESLLDWANRKRRLANFSLREETFGSEQGAPRAWAMHMQHREGSPTNESYRHWHVDVALKQANAGFDARVMVSHTLDHLFVGWAPAPPEPSAPAFLYDWLAHEALSVRSGQFPIAAVNQEPRSGRVPLKERIGAFKVLPESVDQLARLVFDPNRRMPVLVIHGEVNPVTFPILPNRLQQLLLGSCYVVSAPPAAGWGPAWSKHFPRGFECPINSVRLYQADASAQNRSDSVRHRFFTDDDIHRNGGSAAFIGMIRDGINRRLLASRPGRIATCEDVLALRASNDFESQRAKLSSKDEELSLFTSEHQRLLEKNQLLDQLLQEADSDLQRTKAELDALRPYAEQLANELQATKAEQNTLAPNTDQNELLERLFRDQSTVRDQLEILNKVFPESVVILPSAYRSAEGADQFEHIERLRDLLVKLVTDYRQTLLSGRGNSDAYRVFGRNDFTTKEAESLSREGRAARTFEYQEKPIFMEQHLKIGVKDSEAHCLRVHFYWDAATKRIVIGHCGKHLPL